LLPPCVGLGPASPSARRRWSVHPHVRGARGWPGLLRGPDRGPSPRAWGSEVTLCVVHRGERSIPTCVGLGTCHLVTEMTFTGPSPRAWGSVTGLGSAASEWRSIPTCVGLGGCGRGTRDRYSVHPHVRGARVLRVLLPALLAGPSPRAWGSVQLLLCGVALRRSIPTCVGLGRRRSGPRP